MSLLSELDVFPPFLDVVRAFGFRSDDVGDDFQGYHYSVKNIQAQGVSGRIYGIGSSTDLLSITDIIDRDLFQCSISRAQWASHGKPLVDAQYCGLSSV